MSDPPLFDIDFQNVWVWTSLEYSIKTYTQNHIKGVCNILGSIGVLLSKGIGIVIGSILNGNISYLFDHLTWIVIIGVVGGAILQLHFLNLSLKYFDASVIAPLKYVGTNILVVIGSCLLYKEFNELTFG